MSSCETWATRRAAALLVLLTGASPSLAQDASPHDAPPDEASATSAGQESQRVAADAVETARIHFKRGVDSYRDGDLSTALIEFKRAYAIAPNYHLLYNLGQVSRELRNYPEAERTYREYLKRGGSDIDAARRQEVDAEIAKAAARTASLVISVDEPNAELFVDDVSVGRAPLGDVVRVSAGQRRVSASLPGLPRVTKVVDAAGGETVVVKLQLQPEAAPMVTREAMRPVRAAAPATGGIPSAAIVLGVSTVVLGVGAGVMALLAKREADQYEATLERRTTEAELTALSKGAKTKALVTDILLGGSLAAGVATLVVALSDGSRSSERAPSGMALAWTVGPGSVQLGGQF